MGSWFNARIAVVAVSLFVLVRLTQRGDDAALAVRYDVIGCALLLVLYAAVYLGPLWRTFGFRRVFGSLLSVIAAWTAAALALVADATFPRIPGEPHINWTMLAFCVAAAIAFFLFFDSTGKAYRLRTEILAVRQVRRSTG